MQPIRIALTASQADVWALVLTAAGIPNAVARDEAGWIVLAAADDAVRAGGALAAYEEERRERVAPVAREPYPWMSGVAVGLLLLWLFTVTGPPAPGSPWFERGAAAAGRMLHGEPWRAVTALTLHADVVHVAGNAVALAVLVPPLVQRFGAGAAVVILLLAGAGGNLVAAVAHTAAHVAVGASTAAFGAVGVLVAFPLVPGAARAPRKRWLAPVAGVVLLTTLGAARNADLIAHASGFCTGIVVGLAGSVAVRQRPRAIGQWLAGTLAGVVVAGAWALALRT